MSGKKFIGFDLGAESGRCVVAILNNDKISLHEVHRFTTHNVKYKNGFHWDILAIYKEIIEGLQNAGKKFGPDFYGIGVDTWGVDYVLIDPGNRIMGYPYHYRDDRTDLMMNKAFEIVSREELYKNIGTQFAQYNTLFQLLAEKNEMFNQLDYADRMLLMPDFINFLLTGEKKSEFCISSTTGLTDPKTRNWNWQIIDSLGFPGNIFPEMVEPGYKLGSLSHSIARQTGLSDNIPVFASAGHDTASAVASIPVTQKNWAYLSSGTWSLIGIELAYPILTDEAMKYNFTNEGGVEGTNRFLKNILGLWTIQECRRYWLMEGEEYTYQELTELAGKESEANAWVDLNDQRFLKPGDMPKKITAYLQETGQVFKLNPGFIVRVILESLAYTYRDTVNQIEEVTGKIIDTLHVVGGGIKNELLTQFIADSIGIPVIAGPVEGTVVGNIGVIAVASGSASNISEWRKLVAKSFQVKRYDPLDSEYYNKNESNYRKILKT